jgi:hypothetical protein
VESSAVSMTCILNLKGSDNCVYNTWNHWASGLCPSSGILHNHNAQNKQNKQTPWPLVRERTISTDRPPLVDEI